MNTNLFPMCKGTVLRIMHIQFSPTLSMLGNVLICECYTVCIGYLYVLFCCSHPYNIVTVVSMICDHNMVLYLCISQITLVVLILKDGKSLGTLEILVLSIGLPFSIIYALLGWLAVSCIKLQINIINIILFLSWNVQKDKFLLKISALFDSCFVLHDTIMCPMD